MAAVVEGEGFKNMDKDLARAQTTERRVALLLSQALKAKIVGDSLDKGQFSKYDIELMLPPKELSDSEVEYNFITIEVKEDFGCHRTGNVPVEYASRGKQSGVETTEADFYLYVVHAKEGVKHLLMRTSALKRVIKEKKYSRIVNGGDPGSNTYCYLFKIAALEKISKNIITISP